MRAGLVSTRSVRVIIIDINEPVWFRWWVNNPAASSPYFDLTAIIGAVRAMVGEWGKRGLLSQALMVLLYFRLGKISGQMERMAARFVAGRGWRLKPRMEGVATVRAERVAGQPARIWPTRFAWLIRVGGWQVAGRGSQLRAVLETPEMIALLRAVPQAARVLRPLCRMLAIETSLLRPLAPGEVVVPKVRKQRVCRVREVVVHLRPLQPYVLAAVRAWKKRGG